jgi:DNA-directed RNA polymerase subunit RPC12/RpoP
MFMGQRVIFGKVTLLILVPGISSAWSVQETLTGNVAIPWVDLTGGYQSLPNAVSGSRGPFKCMQCGRQYRWKKTLVAHLRHECGMEPQFKCPYCPMQTKQSSNLKNHIRNKHPDAAILKRTEKRVNLFLP